MLKIGEKKGAVELSISTIVIVVLGMSMLILGVVLVKNIFSGSTNAVDQLNDQTINEINKLFGEDKKIVIYPSTGKVTVRQGKEEGFAVGISNKLTGSAAANAKFSYKVIPVSNILEDCGVTESELMDLFSAGSEETKDIPIPTGEPKPILILFKTGEGDPLCTARFRIDVTQGGNNYDYAFVYVTFRD
jgi:hypothetical protein